MTLKLTCEDLVIYYLWITNYKAAILEVRSYLSTKQGLYGCKKPLYLYIKCPLHAFNNHLFIYIIIGVIINSHLSIRMMFPSEASTRRVLMSAIWPFTFHSRHLLMVAAANDEGRKSCRCTGPYFSSIRNQSAFAKWKQTFIQEHDKIKRYILSNPTW